MKILLENWREYLLLEDLSHYNVGGKVRLYHYSNAEEESTILDPEYFLSRRTSFTRRDYEASDMPRIFFYTNLDHAENIVQQGRTLYSTFVGSSKIYDLTKDPEGLLGKSKPYPDVGTPDIDAVLRSLGNKPKLYRGGGTMKNIRDEGKEPFSGVFYRTGDMDIVVWFEPIEVHKFNPENVDSPLENTEEK